jgi:hypothetical protein
MAARSGATLKQLDDFRHSLAHRMPPFMPPCITTPDKEAAY